LIEADFRHEICTPARLAAWCSFWGEAQSRPMYQETCGKKDDDYNAVLEGICARLSEAGGYRRDPVHTARIIRVTIEGVWLDMMTMASPYVRDEALKTVRICAALCFPEHFDPDGEPGPLSRK
jgi:TetR/AcrR family transcriptional repressor of bet genes